MYRKFGENPTQERYCDEQKLQVRSIPTILCINPRFQGGTDILWLGRAMRRVRLIFLQGKPHVTITSQNTRIFPIRERRRKAEADSRSVRDRNRCPKEELQKMSIWKEKERKRYEQKIQKIISSHFSSCYDAWFNCNGFRSNNACLQQRVGAGNK